MCYTETFYHVPKVLIKLFSHALIPSHEHTVVHHLLTIFRRCTYRRKSSFSQVIIHAKYKLRRYGLARSSLPVYLKDDSEQVVCNDILEINVFQKSRFENFDCKKHI